MLTAATMRGIVSSLRSVARSYSSQATAIGDAVTALGQSVDAVDPLWEGPATERAMSAGRSFTAQVVGLADVISTGQSVLEGLATLADGIATRLASAETILATLVSQEWHGVLPPDAATDRALASGRIQAAEADWQQHCRSAALQLSAVGISLQAMTATPAMGPPYPATPSGLAYAVYLARFSIANGIPMSLLDPGGETKAAAAGLVEQLENTPEGQLVWLLVETAGQGDLSDRDGVASVGDLRAAMDAEAVLAQIAAFEQLTGIEISASAKAELMSQVMATAAVLLASEHVELDDVHIEYPAPGATDPDDPRYVDLVRWLTAGPRGWLVSGVANPDDAQWQTMVEAGSQSRFNAALRYFDIAPNPGGGVVVADFFIPSTNAFILAGDDRDHQDPVFGALGAHDSRIVIVLDLEQGRGSVLLDDSELVLAEDLWHEHAHPIDPDNTANPYDPRNPREGPGILQNVLPITNTVQVDSFLNQVTVGWDAVNSITPAASVDGTFTIQLNEDGVYDLVSVDSDEYPSFGIYHYPMEGSETRTPVVVHQQDSQGIGYALPWWTSWHETAIEMSPLQPAIDISSLTIDVLSGMFEPVDEMAPGPFPGDVDPDVPTTTVQPV